jgi:hypothetical protein
MAPVSGDDRVLVRMRQPAVFSQFPRELGAAVQVMVANKWP